MAHSPPSPLSVIEGSRAQEGVKGTLPERGKEAADPPPPPVRGTRAPRRPGAFSHHGAVRAVLMVLGRQGKRQGGQEGWRRLPAGAGAGAGRAKEAGGGMGGQPAVTLLPVPSPLLLKMCLHPGCPLFEGTDVGEKADYCPRLEAVTGALGERDPIPSYSQPAGSRGAPALQHQHFGGSLTLKCPPPGHPGTETQPGRAGQAGEVPSPTPCLRGTHCVWCPRGQRRPSPAPTPSACGQAAPPLKSQGLSPPDLRLGHVTKGLKRACVTWLAPTGPEKGVRRPGHRPRRKRRSRGRVVSTWAQPPHVNKPS